LGLFASWSTQLNLPQFFHRERLWMRLFYVGVFTIPVALLAFALGLTLWPH
jgi:hypothetical protein